MKRGGYRVRQPASLRDAQHGLHFEPVDVAPRCVSGTMVLALLKLGVPASQIASVCRIDIALVRRTLQSSRSKPMGVEVLDDASFGRVVAYLGVVVARDMPEPRAAAEVEAEMRGCVLDAMAL